MLLELQSFAHSLHTSTVERTRRESRDVGFPVQAKLAAAKQMFARCGRAPWKALRVYDSEGGWVEAGMEAN